MNEQDAGVLSITGWGNDGLVFEQRIYDHGTSATSGMHTYRVTLTYTQEADQPVAALMFRDDTTLLDVVVQIAADMHDARADGDGVIADMQDLLDSLVGALNDLCAPRMEEGGR